MSNPLHEPNAYLRAALAAAESRAELYRLDNERLRAELGEIRRQLDEIVLLAAAQNDQLSDLRTMLRRKMTLRRKGSADAASAADPEGDTAGTVVPPAILAAAENSDSPPSKPKRVRTLRSKGTGRRPPPEGLPEVGYTGKVCQCAHCGSKKLLARDTEQRLRIDAVETIARLRREVLEVVRCKDCGRTTTAEPPSLPCPRAKFTCGFLAWLVTMKFVLLVPLNRIAKLLRRQGNVLPKGTLVRLIDLAAGLAAPIDGVHWKELKARRCLLTDATGLKVVIEGLPETWDAILDTFNGDKTVVYQFALTKHGDEIAALLRGFEGVLMCDAESRLNEVCRREAVLRANCNAHPRRAFRDAEASQPILAKEAGRFISRMYAIERKAAAEGLVGAKLLARRQLEIGPIADAFRVWLEVPRDLLPTDPLGKAVRYYLRHFEDLTRFIDDASIPIDNNPSERAFQDHARLRLNSLFAGSAEGGRRWAILLGIVTTAQRHDLDVQSYLTWMFERRGTRKRAYGLTAAELTPAAYKKVLDEGRRQAAA